MAKYQIEGIFSTKQCENIKEKMEGKSFMDFHIEYGGVAGNNTIIVTTENENYDDEELKNFFIWIALNKL